MGLKVTINTQKKRANGSCPIRLYIYRNGKHAYYPVKDCYCLPGDFKKERVKESHPNHNILNSKIISVFNQFERLILHNPSAGTDEIIRMYEGGVYESTSLFQFIQAFIADCKSGKIKRSVSRQKHYKTTLNLLEEFNPNLNFNSINKDFYDSFMQYMRVTKGHKENTIGLRINVLKTFLNEAIDRNIYKGDEHRKKYFIAPEEEVDAIYLTENELEHIINVDLSRHPHLEKERDRFIVATYLLLRYSDSIKIEKEMFFEQHVDGENRTFFRQKAEKVKKVVIIPVKKIVKTILEKNNYEMNFDTNFESNWKVKVIGQLASKKCHSLQEKIIMNGQTDFKYEFISTHTARRSGATNLWLSGIDEHSLCQFGGWKKKENMLKYIRASQLENAMRHANHESFR